KTKTMKTKRNFMPILAVLGMVAVFTFSSCEKDDDVMINPTPTEPTADIVKLASTNPDLSILAEALTRANLVSALEGSGPFTVFAPTNEAFNQLLNDLGATSLDDISTDILTNVLLYHVLNGKVTSMEIEPGYVNTLSIGPDNNQVSLLVGYNDSSNKNTAAAVNTNILFLNNDASVVTADVMATNGVVHVINKVLLPPNVVDLAIDNSSFSILVEAVVKAELVETLMGDGPFTIFAPTNAAFEELFAQLKVSGVQDLTKDQLVPILLYHVVSGNVRSSDLSSRNVSTLNGEISIEVGSMVTINDNTNVVYTDLQGVNGVIHVIDKVLLP
nr:fasciclin domain-containing protein [Tenuifilaceae bacterium]